MERSISSHLVRLRRSHPFLATISLHTRYRFSPAVTAFESKRREVWINPDYFVRLDPEAQSGLLLHVTLHCALLHAQRCGPRHPAIWNTAADIVVNNIILETGLFQPPADTAVEPAYGEDSVEQVYEALVSAVRNSPALQQLAQQGLSASATGMPSGAGYEQNGLEPLPGNGTGSPMALPMPQHDKSEVHHNTGNEGVKAKSSPTSASAFTSGVAAPALEQRYPRHRDLASGTEDGINQQREEHSTEQYWRGVFRKAEAAARLAERHQGRLPAGLQREVDRMLEPQLDWRWLLWNHVVRTPSDFDGYDRRFIHSGLYIDQLQADTLRVIVAIDTSGSIWDEELEQFMGELAAIRACYHFINLSFYYVDAAVDGPYYYDELTTVAVPTGGGGTDFSVLFDRVAEEDGDNNFGDKLLVYFTDGHGDFPTEPPLYETMWVVVPDGLASEDFPFGKVARLNS